MPGPKKRWQKGRLVGVVPNPIGPGPAYVFADVGKHGEPVGEVKVIAPPEPGKPMPIGAQMADFKPEFGTPDFKYNVTATVGERTSSGPIQVATAKYRDGWDRTFGSKGVN